MTLGRAPRADAFFMAAPGGSRFCIHHPPAGKAIASVVYAPPFGEEMNKSRRMAALQSRALADSGCAVLQLDLLGTGDSTGDLADASWSAWIDDLLRAAAWLQARHDAPLWWWGLRSGALLARQAALARPDPAALLFWQAAPTGKPLLQQFLRLRTAASLQGGDKGQNMAELRQLLAAGQTLDVAGYGLPAAVAQGLDAASLDKAAPPARVLWLELSTRDGATLLPASTPVLEAWRKAGCQVHDEVVNGPSFWQTTEIETAPALIERSVAALRAALAS
jgi:uncharacterized protein